MNKYCYNHPNVEAISICHNCQLSFCQNCLMECIEYYYCYKDECQKALEIEVNSSKLANFNQSILSKQIRKRLTNNGIEILGTGASALVGFLTTGLLGAIVGPSIVKSAELLIRDFVNRNLSISEQIKIGDCTAFSLLKIKDNMEKGLEPRDDDFFRNEFNELSNADQIFEGVLLKSKNEHERKKNRYLGNIFGNVSFLKDYSFNEANHILQTVSRLTYRQLCFISFVGRKNEFQDVILRNTDYENIDETNFELISLLQEIYDLQSLGLLHEKIKDSNDAYLAYLSWNNITPESVELSSLGKRYFIIMSLEEVEKNDLVSLIEILK